MLLGSAPLRATGPEIDEGPLVIGLVNNMPDTALRATERQFRELLATASPHIAVHLRLLALPQIPRSETGRAHVDENYEYIDERWAGDVDGLIVTGTEPRAPALPQEPYWPALTKLIDWAEEHTASTIWSCLAAHAAVLYADGVERRALRQKLSGVFDCEAAAGHALTAGAPRQWRIPHSRYNELREEPLVSRGYRILSRSREAGADMFVKNGKSLFVFLQGHPEYDAGALLREYRRDIGRFLVGERDSYPEMPRGYFEADTAATLMAFRRRVLQERRIDLLANFPTAMVERRLVHAWRLPATRLYANWLSYLLAQRSHSRALQDNAPGAAAPRSAQLERGRVERVQ